MTSEIFPRDTTDQKATVPSNDFFLPESLRKDQAETAFLDLIDDLGREDALVITHNDADGLTSGAYMKHWFESVTEHTATVYPTSYRGACALPTALKLLNDKVNVKPGWVFVTDLGASLFDAAKPEVRALYPDTEVAWIDHHQWEDDQLSELRRTAHGVVDDSFCATQLVMELRDGAHDLSVPLASDGASETHRELAAVVNDHDLWIKDDARSDRVAIFAEYAADAEYMEAALDGIEMLETYAGDIEAYEAENDALLARGVESAAFVEMSGVEVAIAYGFGPSASVGNELVEVEGADLAVVMRPNGGVSFYAHSNEEEFTQCHKVAAELDGGGHPTAAGGNLGLETFDEFLTLWTGETDAYRDVIEDAVSAVVAPAE